MRTGDYVEFKLSETKELYRGYLKSLLGILFVIAEDGQVYDFKSIDMIRVCPEEYRKARKKIFYVPPFLPCFEEAYA